MCLRTVLCRATARFFALSPDDTWTTARRSSTYEPLRHRLSRSTHLSLRPLYVDHKHTYTAPFCSGARHSSLVGLYNYMLWLRFSLSGDSFMGRPSATTAAAAATALDDGRHVLLWSTFMPSGPPPFFGCRRCLPMPPLLLTPPFCKAFCARFSFAKLFGRRAARPPPCTFALCSMRRMRSSSGSIGSAAAAASRASNKSVGAGSSLATTSMQRAAFVELLNLPRNAGTRSSNVCSVGVDDEIEARRLFGLARRTLARAPWTPSKESLVSRFVLSKSQVP